MREAHHTGQPTGYEFGPFRVDVHGGTVYRDDRRVMLPPKAVDILRLLLESPGQVVTRTDLLREVWPDVVVEEGNISKLVFQLREALAEVPEFAPAIETVPKRGYRFVAPVRVLYDGSPKRHPEATGALVAPLPAAGTSERQPEPGKGRRRLLAAGAAVILLAAAVVVVVVFSTHDSRRVQHPALDPHALAVLPFKNIGSDPTDAYFRDGLAEDILTHLSKVPGLHVVSWASTAGYQGSIPLRAIGTELGVGSVVEGTVRRGGGRARITVQLTDVWTGRHLWAETYDREIRDVLDVQSDIATQVAAALAVRREEPGDRAARRGSTANAEAYDLYLRALSDLDHWGEGPRLASAVRNLNAAVTLDPRFASAHAQLGLAHIREGYLAGGTGWVKPATEEAARALEIDPGLALPHVVRSSLLYSWPGNWDAEGAIRELRLAQELEPSVGHLELAELFAHLGLEEPALRELTQALSFDPLSEWTRDRAIAVHAWLGRWTDALEHAHAWFPDAQLTDHPGWRAAVHLGQAADVLREVPPPDQPRGQRLLNQAMVAMAVVKGSSVEARALIEALVDAYPRRPSTNWHHFMYDIACAQALTGDADAAVDWLRRSAEGGFPNYLVFSRDPFLDSVRTHPRYLALMAELQPRWEDWQRQYGAGRTLSPPHTR